MDIQANEVARLESRLLGFAPARQWYVTTVSFPDTPNTDIDIPHPLKPSDPEKVNYEVLQATHPTLVWHDRSASRQQWGQGYIRLRSTMASAQVLLLLTVGDGKQSLLDFADHDTTPLFGFPGGITERGRTTAMGEWLPYTPVFRSASNPQPAIGDATVAGWYSDVGLMRFFDIKIIFGSTTTFGTGAHAFSLPSTPTFFGVASGYLFDASAPLNYNAVGLLAGTDGVALYPAATSATTTTPTHPFTWAQNDWVMVSGWYQRAA